jgi:chemotaxis response regulator CheB
MSEERVTKILFMDNDEMSFAVRQCIARAILSLPPIELFHVTKASEAIDALEAICPDVIVIDDSCLEEFELLRDNASINYPPILLQSNKPSIHQAIGNDLRVNCIEKSASIDGLRRTLVAATDMAHGRVSSEPAALH